MIKTNSPIKQQDIHVTIQQQEPPQLIQFQEPDIQIIQESSQGQDQHNKSISKSHVIEKQSVISTQTQKRQTEFKQKVQNYLFQNRNSIPMNLQRGRAQQQKDGQLIDQLDNIRQNQKYYQQAQHFILMFNKKPADAITDYITKGFIIQDSPEAIAKYIINKQGIDKAVLGQYFGKNDKKVLSILHAYCKLLNFTNQQFDKALRTLLCKFRLPGQAQQIQRVIWQFSLAFYQANVQSYDNADQLFPLAYAIIMLSTDAHNPKQEHKMTCQQFVKNTRRPCPSISQQYLVNIFERITSQKFQTQTDYFATIYGRLKDLAVSNIGQAIQITKELIKGDIFLKICKNTNKFVQRKVFLSQDQQKIQWISDPPSSIQTPRFIWIKDILDLTLGVGSIVMKKNKVPQQFDSLCFTISTIERTLDLKARTTKIRGKWINYLRSLLIQRRQKKRQALQDKFKTTVNNDVIEDMWNTDIFPLWDRHWDYKQRKPKEKGYIARGLQAICSCWTDNKKNDSLNQKTNHSGLIIKNNLLQSLWKHGLPVPSRKTLWPLIIGNNLSITPMIVDDLKKRRKKVNEFKSMQMSQQVTDLGQILITMRADLPPVRDLLLLSNVFVSAFPKEQNNQLISCLLNFIHSFHFLSFYRGDKTEIQLRILLFQHLMQINVPSVKNHFKGIRIQTRMFLVTWFLSSFANCFQGDFLFRIWDNFLLQGQIYLFKVGIALIKFYQIQLKMCTFNEGLKMLKFPKNTNLILFFHILQEEIDVKDEYYEQYIQKRKHAIIKTKVQSIPLQ